MAVTCEKCYELARSVKAAEELLKITKGQFNGHVRNKASAREPGHYTKEK